MRTNPGQAQPRRARRPSARAAIAVALLLSAPAAAQEIEPRIDHPPLSRALRGEPVVLRALITSPVGRPIAEPAAFVRPAGTGRFARIPLAPESSVPGLFTARLSDHLISSDFDYYLEAFDADGNGPARSGSPESPHRVALAAPAIATPAPTPSQQVQTILVAPVTPPRSHALTANLALLGGAAGGASAILFLERRRQQQSFRDAQRLGWSYDARDWRDHEWMSIVGTTLASAGGALFIGALVSSLWYDDAPPPPRAVPAGRTP